MTRGVLHHAARYPSAWLLIVVAVFSALSAFARSDRAPGADFYQFWVVGQSIRAGGPHDVYSDAARRQLGAEARSQAQSEPDSRREVISRHRMVLETYSSPLLYTLFAAFSGGSYDEDLRRLRWGTIAATVASLLVFGMAVGHGSTSLAIFVLAFTAWYGPLDSELRVGNVNTLLMLVAAAMIAAAGRTPRGRWGVIRGVALGAGIAFKPTLLGVLGLVLLDRLVGRRWWDARAEAIGVLVGVTIGVVVGAIGLGPGAWIAWLGALATLPDTIIGIQAGNFSLARLVGDAIGDGAALAARVAVVSVACVATWRAARARRSNTALDGVGAAPAARSPDREHDVAVTALALLTTVLVSRLSWLHYYVLAAPAFVYLLRPRASSASMGSAASSITIAFTLAGFCCVAVSPAPLLGLRLQPEGLAVMTILGATLLFASLSADLLGASPREAQRNR